MSDPTRAPAGWYEDGSGARWYWDGDAWTQYEAPASETIPLTPVDPDSTATAVLVTGDEHPTIPFVWGSRGSDAAGYRYGGAPRASGWNESSAAHAPTAPTAPTVPYAASAPTAPKRPYAAVGANPYASPGSHPAPSTTALPGHPFTEPSNPGPNVVGIIALLVAIAGLVVAFIPAMSGFAWILVPVAFVLSLVGLFLRGAKWPAVMGLVVSIIAVVVGIVMLVTSLIGSIGTMVDEIDDAIPDVPGFPLPGEDAPGGDPDAQPEAPGAPEAPVAGDLAFGETTTWGDGVALTVSAPEPYTPSDVAVGATRANHVVFTLTITNNSAEDLQPLPLPSLSSGDQEVSQIFDIGSDVLGAGDDVGFPPTAVVEPGGSVSWRAAWSLDDPSALTLQVAPGFLYPSATFTNAP
ncbi:hypothetical protein [Agromyces bauzanensis]|uniref:DUF2510 domain-containing protein n=1 Tax=Agromyces bauzanensis TaxID=1308924 RepID=A0A917PDQ3_9MICO|nr:hypothetical protein [Agromyces bauzanensis]GGJ72189.1 hypothetical protein GCM10011372_07690 [Agromyces bauzanensis]